MVVAGLRFDTRDDLGGVTGPRWKVSGPEPLDEGKFAERHPAGL